jgi:hypothetical protein
MRPVFIKTPTAYGVFKTCKKERTTIIPITKQGKDSCIIINIIKNIFKKT